MKKPKWLEKVGFAGRGKGLTLRLDKRAGIAFGVIALVVTGVLFWLYLLNQSKIENRGDPTLPPVATTELSATETQEVYLQFSPWVGSAVIDGQETPVNSTGIVWLRENGSLDTSRWSLPETVSIWSVTRPPEITNVTRENELAQIGTNTGRTYNVYVGQPFILERVPDSVFMISSETGEILSATRGEVLRVRELSEKG